jgi:N-acetylglucosaminyldiphosphoundecaprenol N-acetyl-beta-D-mannosaminyltransferase
MSPSAQALAPTLDVAAPGGARATASAVATMRFGDVTITETGDFPPPRGPACWVFLTLNAEIALSLSGNPALRALLQMPRARVSVDGQWLCWALRRKYPRQPLHKLSGSDLVYTLAAQCAGEGRRLLLLGGHAEANALAVMRLRRLLPALHVAGFAPTPYRAATSAEGAAEETAAHQAALEAIRAFRPDYVVLGLGAEKEQRLCLQLAPMLDGQVNGLLCFGGAIDMVSGRVQRAPRWMQRSGLESVYRVWEQPSRLPRWLRSLRLLPMLAAGRY